VSGNPNGRPRIVAEVRDLARRHTANAIAALVAIMQKGESDAARVSAANALLDRGYGRPVTGGPVMLDEIDGTLSEQGRTIIKAMAKGKLTPAEASQLLSGLAAFGKIIEADELAKRVERLEGKANDNHKEQG